MSSQSIAGEQKLSDLALSGYHLDHGAVTIETTGQAKLRVSFITPQMARVQIAPTGQFSDNPSPAVEKVPSPALDVRVSDDGPTLDIFTKGLSLHINKAHLRVDAFDGEGKALTLEAPDGGTRWDTTSGALQQTRILSPQEHIYGLGQDNSNRGTLDRRGTVRDLWTGQQINSGNVTANYPVPFYLSTGSDGRGYGIFVDNVWHMRFDLGKTQSDRLTWTAPGGPIDYYIIDGPSFKTVIDQYTQLTGRPSMLPLYAFGYWQSRCFFQNFADIQNTVDRFKTDGLPIDVLVIDSNWPKINVDFLWSKDFLSGKTPEQWISSLHADGMHVMLSTKGPMIRKDSENYSDALSRGLFATDGKGNTITTGYYGGELMDFTHPAMEPWLATQLLPLSKEGIDAWWLDLNEPEGEPPQAVYNKGKSADIHNTFPLLTYKAYFDYQRSLDAEDRPVILGRAAGAGTQRYSGIVWTGDINSDWPTFQAHIPEAQNTGLSGLPYWTNDSGGFLSGFLNNDRYGAHAELYQRWFEFTTFIPIMRAHKAGPAEPYEYGADTEATAKKYMQLRYRLLPYIYTLAHETVTTGLPMLRPLLLDYQNDPRSADTKSEFMFGDDLLVAPVIWPGAVSRQIYFPPGNWISYDEGFEVSGGQTIGVSAPINRIPLFVKAGTILPTAPDMMYSGEKPWDPVTLDIWPQGLSSGSLYEDDKSTMAFARGESTTTTFNNTEVPGESETLMIVPTNAKFGPKQWIARFHLTSVPIGVKVDGVTTTGWTFDAASTTLFVPFPGERVAHKVQVALDGSAHPRATPPRVVAPANDETVSAVAPKQIPQFLPAPILPIRVEAANYDKGAEGFAYHIITPAKTTLYRQDGVPIIASSDDGGGYALPDLKKDEWLAYTLDADKGGWFSVSARVLPSAKSQLTFLRKRFIPLTAVDIPAPAPRSAKWIDVAGKSLFYLPPGEQILTARVTAPGFQFGHFTFARARDAVVKVEAESGKLTGATVNNDHPGYMGTGFVAGIAGQGSSIVIPLTVPATGKYLVILRYANGLSEAKTILTPAGGHPIALTMTPTGEWSDYGETGVALDLKAGATSFTVKGSDIGVINVDQLKLIPLF